MNRRQFLQYLSLLGLSSGSLSGCVKTLKDRYQMQNFGDLRLLHMTDCHAQLQPIYFREPSVNIGIGKKNGLPPHIVGSAFLEFFGIKANSAEAYAFTHLNFSEAAGVFGKMGGFAHLASLVKLLRAGDDPENTLLLDGGDSWQGSATALWTKGRDMLESCNLLGVDVMTGHWEFTHGEQQVRENLAAFNGDFVAQNIALSEEAQFEMDADSSAVFKPYVIKQTKNARIAIIGQAFPYTPIANPQRFIPNWQFGIQEQRLQTIVNDIRGQKLADAVILLSHNGMDVDLKLASRVMGIDFILGGHTHDAMPRPVPVRNHSGITWVSNAGSHGKFLAVLDLHIKAGRVSDFQYQLLPVFSHLLEADPDMQQLINNIRQPYLQQLQQPLAVTESLLYRRANFYASFDQIIVDALRQLNQAQISLSPGFRWGTSVLPGQQISLDDVMNQTAISYPETYVRNISGAELKQILEDVCDNLFNKDPYYRQGGDMVRVGGLFYRCFPHAPFGQRITDLRLTNGQAVEARKSYKVSGWATVGQVSSGKPVWELVSAYLKQQQTVKISEKRTVAYL